MTMTDDTRRLAAVPAPEALHLLPPDEQQRRAREMAAADPDITGGELARRFGRTDDAGKRWGRRQAEVGRKEASAGHRADTGGQVDAPPVPPPPPPPPPPEAHTAPEEAEPGRHTLSAGGVRVPVTVAVPLAVVLLSPMVMSAGSLAAWGRDSLGLDDRAAWLVPATLDAAGLTCVFLAGAAMLRGRSAGAARFLVWAFAAASALANHRHGVEVSADAAVYFPAMPIVAAVLLDLVFRYVRREALEGLGALEAPLPRYRAARWLVAPRETWGAWRLAVRRGLTDPQQAVAAWQADRERRRAGRGDRADSAVTG